MSLVDQKVLINDNVQTTPIKWTARLFLRFYLYKKVDPYKLEMNKDNILLNKSLKCQYNNRKL
uniref:Uncharacterized protein n=1 Tax=Heterorhabditis bacteriophora TaxID=37862 RepID=A0A1I7WZL6_HETBA